MHHIFKDDGIGIDNISNNKEIKRFIYLIIFSNQIFPIKTKIFIHFYSHILFKRLNISLKRICFLCITVMIYLI